MRTPKTKAGTSAISRCWGWPMRWAWIGISWMTTRTWSFSSTPGKTRRWLCSEGSPNRSSGRTSPNYWKDIRGNSRRWLVLKRKVNKKVNKKPRPSLGLLKPVSPPRPKINLNLKLNLKRKLKSKKPKLLLLRLPGLKPRTRSLPLTKKNRWHRSSNLTKVKIW